MSEERIKFILNAIKAPLNHPLFLPRVFALTAKNNQNIQLNKLKDPLYQIFVEEYEELSRRLDRSQIQESTSVRNILRTRQLATLLVNDKGELNTDWIPLAIEYLEKHLFSLGPGRQYDSKRNKHILSVLKTLQKNKDAFRLFKNINKPFSNKYAEDLIRDTLLLSPHTLITDAHTKRAVLSAWFCYLRQNIGSCFATAPAEVVHDEQPELFLQDISDLLATGRLKRTFGGHEYIVPISASWGNGDLKKPLFMQYSTKGIHPEIWYSPGLVAAFEAVGLFHDGDTLKQKVMQMKNWLDPIFQSKNSYQLFFIITAEEIIRKIMLQSFGLTEQTINDFENRPRNMIQGQLMLQVPHPTKNRNGGVGEKCANFLFLFEMAKNAFKALSDNAILKAWEFTLASFSETKLEFTTWNLYASLGMKTDEPGGIGHCIYQVIQKKLDTANKKMQDIQYEYEMVYTQLKTLETRMRTASTDSELQWIKPEYQSRTNEFYSLQEQRDQAQEQAQNLVNLYDAIYKLYLELFKDYFQEVYDADVQEVVVGPFDDTPAGFRLVYKHGRSNTSQWTRIKNHNEFIDALSSFFSSTEPQIASLLEEKNLSKDLADVVTAIITHVKTKEFIESAFYRMAIAHQTTPIKDPLEHLDRVEKKPWVYTSGGTMNTLVNCYYRLNNKPTEVSKWVENEMELLVFLADSLKHVPPSYMNPYVKRERSSMLMQSPTHAFILKPNLSPFNETWSNEDFTYTYVRDRLVKPMEELIESLNLNEEMLSYLIEMLAEKVPENYRPRFKTVFQRLSGPLNSILFRDYLISMMEHDRGLNIRGRPVLGEDEVDSFLYSHLPLFPIYELKDRIRRILILLPGINEQKTEEILVLFDQISESRTHLLVTAKQLQDICKGLICLYNLKTACEYDYPLLISLAAQKLGYAMNTPIIFADTNWVKDEFAFLVNPGTGRLELWRIDYTGTVGYPMSDWKQWINGTRQDQKWGIYVKPYEYGQI